MQIGEEVSPNKIIDNTIPALTKFFNKIIKEYNKDEIFNENNENLNEIIEYFNEIIEIKTIMIKKNNKNIRKT